MNTISGPVGTTVNPFIRFSALLLFAKEGQWEKALQGLLSLIQKLEEKRPRSCTKASFSLLVFGIFVFGSYLKVELEGITGNLIL